MTARTAFGGRHRRPPNAAQGDDPVTLRTTAAHAPATAAVLDYAEAMSTLASGVVLVTCRLDGRPWGVTISAFSSVSADPPTVLVSLGTEGIAARAIAATRRFGVSVLAAQQRPLARLGSAPGAAKFLEPFVEAASDTGASPVVAGSLAHLDCDVVEAVAVADHTVFFGRVRTARAARAGTPLLYHRREYRTLGGPARAHTPIARSVGCLSN